MSMRISRLQHPWRERNEGRVIRLLAAALILTLAGCGIPSVSFIADPIPLSQTGSTLRFRHDTENDSEDFKGYELYYKIYNANDLATIDGDRSFIEGADTPGTGRLTSREFLRMVRTDDGLPSGDGLEDPPMLPVSASARDQGFEVSVDFSAAAQTVVVTNPGESAASVQLFRQSVLIEEQSAQSFDLFLDPAGFQYTPGDPGSDADLALMLNEAYDPVNTYRATVWAIAYGLDATNFQRIYSLPVYLGIVDL